MDAPAFIGYAVGGGASVALILFFVYAIQRNCRSSCKTQVRVGAPAGEAIPSPEATPISKTRTVIKDIAQTVEDIVS